MDAAMEHACIPPALLLACGNSLRQDDGIGLRVAEAAEKALPASRLRILAAPQFTPEMAVELSEARLAIFVDASAAEEPGSIRVLQIAPETEAPGTHRLDPPALLALAESLCGQLPEHAFVLTIGAAAFGYGEGLSRPVQQAVPRAVRLVTSLVAAFSRETKTSV